MLVVRPLAFALGGAASAVLNLRLTVPLFWSIIVGIAVYVAVDFVAEHFLFGHID